MPSLTTRATISLPQLTFDTRDPLLLCLRKKFREEFNTTEHKSYEATDAEETEELSLLGDVDIYAPQFNKRVPGIGLSERVHIAAADKKKVDKTSISLPIPRTLKLFNFNTKPFILESCIPIEEFRNQYPPELLFDFILEARRIHSPPTPALLPRSSLSGATLHSVASPHRFTEIPNLQPDVPQDLQQPDSASLVVLEPHLYYNIDQNFVKEVYKWLDHINIPFALSFPNFNSRIIHSKDISNLIQAYDCVNHTDTPSASSRPDSHSRAIDNEAAWNLVEDNVRQRKSPRRQTPEQNVD